MAKTEVRAYCSPTCVLLAFNWEDGTKHADFLGFAIQRDPGYGKDGKPQFLFNKIDFVPLTKASKPKGSDKAPIQKFNWWDGGLKTADRGRKFTYTVTPVLGTGAKDLKLQKAAAGSVKVTIPPIEDHGIATYGCSWTPSSTPSSTRNLRCSSACSRRPTPRCCPRSLPPATAAS